MSHPAIDAADILDDHELTYNQHTWDGECTCGVRIHTRHTIHQGHMLIAAGLISDFGPEHFRPDEDPVTRLATVIHRHTGTPKWSAKKAAQAAFHSGAIIANPDAHEQEGAVPTS